MPRTSVLWHFLLADFCGKKPSECLFWASESLFMRQLVGFNGLV